MRSKERTSTEPFQPATPQELVARALAYIDEDGKIWQKAEDGSVIIAEPLPSVDLERLPNDVWLHTLFTVAWVLFRRYEHNVTFDEETLQILAIYLGAYCHDPRFLETASSLIHYDTRTWESPSLPDSESPHASALRLRR